MKMKRLFSCLLAVILVCSTMLTGCSGNDDTMFSDMKDMARIKTCEFNTKGSIALNSDDEDDIPIDIAFSMDGKTNGKSMAANISITWGAFTYTLDDFIRVTDGTMYMNISSIFSSLSSMFGSSDLIPGMKTWVSIPFSETSDETQELSLDFYDTIIDSFEKICKDQDISQSEDTWTLNISGEQMVSFLQNGLEEINTNFSSWYDLYVTLLEKSGNTELLQDYSALFGEDSDEAVSEDLIQELKDGKEDAVKEWGEAYTSYKEKLDNLETSISSGEANASAKYNISLSGKEGSRNAEQAMEFNLENTKTASSAIVNINQKITETNDVTVEAPNAEDVMTFEEYSELMSSFMNLGGLLDDSSLDDDYGYDEESALSDEETAAITASLKDNQVYLYNSYYKDMKPYVLTFDTGLYEIEENIGDYNMDFWIKATDSSYVSIAYDQGNLAEDMVTYYLEEGQKTSAMSTDIGDISYYTATEPDEWNCYTTTFGIQLDEESYLVGILELEKDANVDAETCLKGLLEELKPYTENDSI